MYIQPWKTLQAAARGRRWALYTIACVLSLFLIGCDDVERKETGKNPSPATSGEALPDFPPPKPGKDGKVDPLDQARYDVERFTSAAAKAESRYRTLRRIHQEEALDTQVNWITGIALIVAAVAGVAAFIVPVGKKTVIGVAIGCVVIAACAQAFREAVPYLPWIGGTLLIGAGLWVAINWRKLGQTTQAAADHGDRLETWITEDLLPLLNDEQRAVALKIIRDVKDESQKQAVRMGVHNPLQYLRGKTPTLWKKLIDKVG